MNNFWRIIAVAILVLVLIALYWTRYQVIPVNYAYAPAFYKINRVSGEITLTVGKEFVQVKEIDEKMTAPPAPAPGPAPGPRARVSTGKCSPCTSPRKRCPESYSRTGAKEVINSIHKKAGSRALLFLSESQCRGRSKIGPSGGNIRDSSFMGSAGRV